MQYAKDELRSLLNSDIDVFFDRLAFYSQNYKDITDLFLLNKFKEKVKDRVPSNFKKLKVALIGGVTFHPLSTFLSQSLFGNKIDANVFVGQFDSYASEIMNPDSDYRKFSPDVTVIFPSPRLLSHPLQLVSSAEEVVEHASSVCDQLVSLAKKVREDVGGEVILCNFPLPADLDLGVVRSKSPASPWRYTKKINELINERHQGLTLCDLEFLSARVGTRVSLDRKGWYESKQLGSLCFQKEVIRELTAVISSFNSSMKKVIVCDLDNTLWGGVIGDDGVEGIDLGEVNSVGEAFSDFQSAVLSLKQRGVLIAVCSKNEEEAAKAPFSEHSGMRIGLDDVVSFKANWRPKSDNIKEIADELNLGLDSFVFVDDNPAEINIVNQFLPEVSTILLENGPENYIEQLKNCGFFNPLNVTSEDLVKTSQYKEEASRRQLQSSVTDMDDYLGSLGMRMKIQDFCKVDVPRISQLIKKSNQFNLTTKRRSEAEVLDLMKDSNKVGFTVRLSDRFGDYGLISVVILNNTGDSLEIDTWLMSCRVLERSVEVEVLNAICRRGRELGKKYIKGMYLQTKKNKLVEKHFDKLGFKLEKTMESGDKEYCLLLNSFELRDTHINVLGE